MLLLLSYASVRQGRGEAHRPDVIKNPDVRPVRVDLLKDVAHTPGLLKLPVSGETAHQAHEIAPGKRDKRLVPDGRQDVVVQSSENPLSCSFR